MDKLNEFNSDFIDGLIFPAVMFTVFIVLLLVGAIFRLFILQQLPINFG
jgi:hypothetical protein